MNKYSVSPAAGGFHVMSLLKWKMEFFKQNSLCKAEHDISFVIHVNTPFFLMVLCKSGLVDMDWIL